VFSTGRHSKMSVLPLSCPNSLGSWVARTLLQLRSVKGNLNFLSGSCQKRFDYPIRQVVGLHRHNSENAWRQPPLTTAIVLPLSIHPFKFIINPCRLFSRHPTPQHSFAPAMGPPRYSLRSTPYLFNNQAHLTILLPCSFEPRCSDQRAFLFLESQSSQWQVNSRHENGSTP
jgi:hypothetical protein